MDQLLGEKEEEHMTNTRLRTQRVAGLIHRHVYTREHQPAHRPACSDENRVLAKQLGATAI